MPRLSRLSRRVLATRLCDLSRAVKPSRAWRVGACWLLVACAWTPIASAAPGAPSHQTRQSVLAVPTSPTISSEVVVPVGAAPPAPFDRASLVASGLLLVDFDPPDAPWLRGHRGVDLAGDVGAPVVSPSAGVVTFAGVVVDRPLVVVTHAGGLRSTLEPVEAPLAVGTAVAAGEGVGTLADGRLSHCAPSSCLHWGVRRGEVYLDPLVLLGVVEPVVLLPLLGSGAVAAGELLSQTPHRGRVHLRDA